MAVPFAPVSRNQSIDIEQAKKMIPTKVQPLTTQPKASLPTRRPSPAQPTPQPKKELTKEQFKKMIKKAESDGMEGRAFYKKMIDA